MPQRPQCTDSRPQPSGLSLVSESTERDGEHKDSPNRYPERCTDRVAHGLASPTGHLRLPTRDPARVDRLQPAKSDAPLQWKNAA